MAFNVGSIVAKVEADISNFQKGMGEAEKTADGFSKNMVSMGKVAGAAMVAVGVAVAGAMVIAGKKGVEAASEFEQQEIAFTTLLKDREKAIAAIKDIEADAKKTPYNLPDLIKANQLLISAGVSTADARDNVLSLGNAIAATGGGTAELNRLAVNLQQIKAVGKASALDIKQFAFAGINIYQLLADATGKNVDQVKEMDVSYELLTQALAKASGEGGMFAGAMEAQSHSLQGLKSNLQDVISITLKDIVTETGLYDGLKRITEQSVIFISNAGPQIVKVVTDLQNAFGWLSQQANLFINEFLVKFAPLLEPIIANLKETWSVIMLQLKPALDEFILAIGPYLQVYLESSAVLFGILLTVFLAFVSGVMTAVSKMLPYLVSAIALITQIFTGLMTFLTGIFTLNWQKVVDGVKLMTDGMVKFVINGLASLLAGIQAFIQGVINFFKSLYNTLVGHSIIPDLINGISSWFNKLPGFIRNAVSGITDIIVSPFQNALNRVRDIYNELKDKLDFTQRHSPSVLDIVNRGVAKVNRAFENLDFGLSMTPNLASSLATNNLGPSINNVVVNLDGAVVGDLSQANDIAEKIGDAIVSRLQMNVRF